MVWPYNGMHFSLKNKKKEKEAKYMLTAWVSLGNTPSERSERMTQRFWVIPDTGAAWEKTIHRLAAEGKRSADSAEN